MNLIFGNEIVSLPPLEIIGSIVVGVTLSKICRVLVIVDNFVSFCIDFVHSETGIVTAYWGDGGGLEDGANGL